MYCGNCGSKISGDARFCDHCGASVKSFTLPGRKKEHRILNLIAFFLAMVGIVSAVMIKNPDELSLARSVAKNNIGTTPEETVEIFLNALAEQDTEIMFACCYIEDYVERFSFSEYIDRVGSMHASTDIAPTEYEGYKMLMKVEMQAAFAKSIQRLTYSLILDREEWSGFSSLLPILADSDMISDFMDVVNTSKLSSMEIKSIDYPCPEEQDYEFYRNIYSNVYCVSNGAQIMTLLEMDGNLLYKGFYLVEIEGYWQIADFYAPVVGTDKNDIATPIENLSEYEELIE